MSKDIFVAIPAYSGDITVHTMHGLLMAMEEASAAGWTLKAKNVHSRLYDAHIARARNAFIGRFLKSDCTDLVFIDADTSWQQGEFTRLLSHRAEFVAGIYRAKRDDIEKYTVIWPKERKMQLDEDSGCPLLEADGVGFGFVRIQRSALEQVIERIKPRKFIDTLLGADGDYECECPGLFDWGQDGLLSEDYFFCRLWRAAGFKVWVDPSLHIDHVGKKTYQGNVVEHLRAETYKAISVEAAA